MPVLDASALTSDPKGAAFLRSVLRPSPRPRLPVENQVAPERKPARSGGVRAWRLCGVTVP